MTVAERHESYVAEFEAFRREAVFGPAALGPAREAAFNRFLDRGFPSTREEEWKFTNVSPIAKTSFRRPASLPVGLPARALEPFVFDGLAVEVVVVNGRLVASLSSTGAPPRGVTVSGLGETFLELAGAWPAVPRSATPFVDLNTAFFDDGVAIHVAPRTIVTGPIHVLFVSAPGHTPVMVSPRLVVVAGEQSQVSIVESYAGVGDGVALTNAVTEIVAGPGAVVDHVKIQRELASSFHIASMFAHLGRAGTLTSRSLAFGGRIARNDIVAVLEGEGAECTLNGLYVAGGDSLIDNHTTIDHAQPHCPSHEVYKGILAGRAKAVFNGKIIVRPQAQKTDAKQTNKALLLTDEAQINTKPQLEIFADDVKCTHGAAIGQLDDEAMFYLRARGVGEAEARSLLIHAFANEILTGIKTDAVRTRVQLVLDAKLAEMNHESA